ncbi:MAG: cupin domain-containing protein [Chloroflexota bacterium]|nr:cupin domain-containing protein [Chloroflexota bacterium]
MLEIYDWSGKGFEPLVFTDKWQAALLNWEPLFDRVNLDEIERHNHSDEVFVLLRGQAVLFTRLEGGKLQALEMAAGKIYNVPAGVWHNIVATRDVSFLIVENRDTHLRDTEIRPISADELAQLDAQLPAWASLKRPGC